MDIKFACHSCGQHLTIDASCGGSTRTCPTCSTQLVTPQLITESIPPKKERSLGPGLLKQRGLEWSFLRQRSLGWNLFCVLILIGALSIFVYLISLSSFKGKTTHDEAGAAYHEATRLCMQYVPEAANFTGDSKLRDYNQKALWCSKANPPHWSAMGYVDCQRPYGASKSPLRQLWVAELMHDRESWHLKRLSIGRETLYASQ